MSGECEVCGEHTMDCKCICPQDREIRLRFGFNLIPSFPIEGIPISPMEQVNHPTHYQGNSFEVIDIIEDFGLNFHLGNAVKYILRAGKKGNKQQDLEKAIWYLEREMSNDQTQ